MTLTRIKATKNKAIWQNEGERAVDAVADTVRARFATPGKHQIYADKRDEAQRYLAEAKGNAQPDLANFPFIAAEVGVSGATPKDVANLWIAMNKQWRQAAATIESLTVSAKARIRAAKSQDEIQAILEQTEQSLDGIGDKPPERPKNKGQEHKFRKTFGSPLPGHP